MRHAVDNGTGLKELAFEGSKFADGAGITHPRKYLDVWDEAYKNSRKIYEIVAGTFDPFEFKKTGSQFSLVDGKAVETIITEPIPIDEIRRREKDNIFLQYEETMSVIKNGYTDSERETWRKQEEEARAWTADNSASTPFIDALLAARRNDLTKAQIIQKIIINADALVVAAAGPTGEKQRKENAIDAATTVQEVRDAIQ